MAERDFQIQALEDKISRLVDSLSQAEQAILYRYLYNLGHRISVVETTIKEAVRNAK